MLSSWLSKITDQSAQLWVRRPINPAGVNQSKLTVLHNMEHVYQVIDVLMNSANTQTCQQCMVNSNNYKVGVTVHRCLQNKAPEYLVDCCTPVSDILSRRHLRSATRHHLTVPRYRLSTFGRRAFSDAGLTVWNSLPDSLRDPALTSNSFSQSLKTNLFRCYHSAHTVQ